MNIVVNITGLLIVAFALAVGQLVFKRIAIELRGQPLSTVMGVILNPSLYLALVLYGGATLLWIWLLSRMPLSRAYPWMSVSMVLVPLMAWQVLGERPGQMFWIGLGLIAAGMLLTQLGSVQ